MQAEDAVDPFHLAARLGVRIVPMEDLEEDYLYIDGYNIALVRVGMCQERREAVAVSILGELAASL